MPSRSRKKRGESSLPAVIEPEATEYGALLSSIREHIRLAQFQAAVAVSRELVVMYWQIGREILLRQKAAGWGARVMERLGADLRREFPRMAGLSRTNLAYMRAFADAYPDEQTVREFPGKIPWGHNTALLDKTHSYEERIWYVRQVIEHGWSRNLLIHHVDNGLYRRSGQAVTNFARTLPAPQSELAAELIKDPYHFSFAGLSTGVEERVLEQGLLAHVRGFLLELGVGFAFVGSQYPVEVGGQTYYVDLLFYHIALRRYFAVDLKVGSFKPEHVGKMNFYLAALDERLRGPENEASIGLVLCRDRNRVVAEYALRGINQPIGIAEYRLTDELPAQLRGSLPSPAELESELAIVEQPAEPGAETPDEPSVFGV